MKYLGEVPPPVLGNCVESLDYLGWHMRGALKMPRGEFSDGLASRTGPAIRAKVQLIFAGWSDDELRLAKSARADITRRCSARSYG